MAKVLLPYDVNADTSVDGLAFELATCLDGDRFEPTMFAGPGESSPDHDLDTIPLRSTNALAALEELQALGPSFDLLHTGARGRIEYVLAWLLRVRNPGLAHVHTMHVDVDPSGKYDTRNRARKARMADAVVAVSESVRDTTRRHLDVRSEVVYNGVNPEFYRPDRDPPAFFADRDVTAPVFAFVGCFEDRKRPIDVLRVADRLPDATFVLRGFGDLEDRIRTMAADRPNVVLPDFLPEVELARLYAAADALLFPSVREGCPMVVLEAMASGTPVLGYRATSMSEVVEHGENGFLATTGDVDELAGYTERLTDPDLAATLGADARESVLEGHTVADMTAGYEAVYERLR